MINEFVYQDKAIKTDAVLSEDGLEVIIEDNKYRVTQLSSGKFNVELNGIKTAVCCAIKDNKCYLDINGILLELLIPTEDSDSASGASDLGHVKDKIYAPMPGKIVKLLVKEGDIVKEKQPMVIVEAMKMENQVITTAAGVVKKINFSDGDQVDTEVPIIELNIADEAVTEKT